MLHQGMFTVQTQYSVDGTAMHVHKGYNCYRMHQSLCVAWHSDSVQSCISGICVIAPNREGKDCLNAGLCRNMTCADAERGNSYKNNQYFSY